MTVIEEGVRVEFAEIGINATDSKIHLCHFPSGGVRVLSVHGYIVNITTMVFNELCRLYKHTA